MRRSKFRRCSWPRSSMKGCLGSTLRVTLGGADWVNAVSVAARKITVDLANWRRILDGRGQRSLQTLRFDDVNDTFFAESALAPLQLGAQDFEEGAADAHQLDFVVGFPADHSVAIANGHAHLAVDA